jgi:hypothetical protein
LPVALPVAWLEDLTLAESEREILGILTATDSHIEGVVSGLAPEALWSGLHTSLRVYATVKRAQAYLKPIIGRLLIELENYPELYRAQGFSTYDDFVTRGAPALFGVPRSEAYRARRLVKCWSGLSPSEFVEVGESKLYDLSRFTGSGDPKAGQWLETAKASTVDELRDKIVQAGECPKELMIPAEITITTSLEVKRAWVEFVNNPAVQAAVGSDHHGAILAACLAEASSSWL